MVSYGATPGILSEDTQRPWGERIKEWRTTRGLTTEQAARLLNVRKQNWDDWEHGKREPHSEQAYVEQFRALQEQVGERPGEDTKDWVASIWRSHIRGGN